MAAGLKGEPHCILLHAAHMPNCYATRSVLTATDPVALPPCQVLADAGNWKAVQEHVTLLSKRRGQLKQAVQAMVRLCMGWLSRLGSTEAREEMIRCLLAITEGKVGTGKGAGWLLRGSAAAVVRVAAARCPAAFPRSPRTSSTHIATPTAPKIYVEIERARLTRQLARMKEAEGKVQEAAEILQVRRGPARQRRLGGAASSRGCWSGPHGAVPQLAAAADGGAARRALTAASRHAPTLCLPAAGGCGGDIWRHGQDGKDCLHPGTGGLWRVPRVG